MNCAKDKGAANCVGWPKEWDGVLTLNKGRLTFWSWLRFRFALSTTTATTLHMSNQAIDPSTNIFVDQGRPLIFDIGLIQDPDLRDNVKKIVLVGDFEISTSTDDDGSRLPKVIWRTPL